MSGATGRFASMLERHLPASDGWKQTTSELIADVGTVPAFVCDDRALVLLIPGDGVTPTQFRSTMDGLLRKAKTPPSPKQPVNPVPYGMVFVVYVFSDELSMDLRAFIGNDRRPITAQRFIQGGWVALASGEANFRVNRNPVETSLLQAMQQAASDVTDGPTVQVSAPTTRGGRGGKTTRDVSADIGDDGGEAPRKKKKGGCGILILGLLLILAGGAAFVYMQYPDLVKQYLPQLFQQGPTDTPSAIPSTSGKSPASGKSGAPAKAPEASKSGAPAKAPEASKSGAPANPAEPSKGGDSEKAPEASQSGEPSGASASGAPSAPR